MSNDTQQSDKLSGSRYGGIEHRLRSIDKQRRLVLATTDDPETQRAMREIGSALYDVSGFRRASELRDGIEHGEHIETDGGTDRCTGDIEHWSMDYEPVAASRYDGDHECQYEGCGEAADWLVDCKATGYTGGRAFFCCQSCSRKNRIYARENELYKAEIDGDLADIIPEDEIEYVWGLQTDTDRPEADR